MFFAFLFISWLQQSTGEVNLPKGTVVEVSTELKLPDGAHDLVIRGNGARLRAVSNFEGRALLSCLNCRNLTIYGLILEGNRDAAPASELPPYDKTFAQSTLRSGLLVERGQGIEIRDCRFEQIAGFAVLVSAARNVKLNALDIASSGGKNANGFNNTTGGILLEDGTSGFIVEHCRVGNVSGNGIWTHSRYGSKRNSDGVISENRFETIGRDAIQIGHATRVQVVHNTGMHIGFPVPLVDQRGGGTPVGVDTSGNVDQCVYAENRFEEINGKCIDLDGFHDGEIRGNQCLNRGKPENYPYGHFGIVMNNTNPDMRSESIRITGNTVEGMKFGGIFVIGRNHTITGNTLTRLNQAHCNEEAARFGCLSFANQPDILRTGIYFGGGAERPDPANANQVTGNTIQGYGMKEHCFGFAPSVLAKNQTIEKNVCQTQP